MWEGFLYIGASKKFGIELEILAFNYTRLTSRQKGNRIGIYKAFRYTDSHSI